jgi:hypothetical protein
MHLPGILPSPNTIAPEMNRAGTDMHRNGRTEHGRRGCEIMFQHAATPFSGSLRACYIRRASALLNQGSFDGGWPVFDAGCVADGYTEQELS